MAAVASLEAVPGTLKYRDSSVEVKEALPGPAEGGEGAVYLVLFSQLLPGKPDQEEEQ